MKKQTTIYLSDKDKKRIERIKEVYEADTTTEVIKRLILEEFDRIEKYSNLTN